MGTSTSACIDVDILDDSNLEGDHTFAISLTGVITPTLAAGLGSPTSTTVTIQDPEGMLSLPSKMDIRVMHIKQSSRLKQ